MHELHYLESSTMSVKSFIELTLVSIHIIACAGQNILDYNDPSLFFTSKELQLILDLKDRICGFTNNTDVKRYDPWFCVKDYKCHSSSLLQAPALVDKDCSGYGDMAQSEVCCFIGNLLVDGSSTTRAIRADKKYWGITQRNSDGIQEYTQFLADQMNPPIREIMNNNKVCGLVPVGSGSDNLFVPYICWHLNCHLAISNQIDVPRIRGELNFTDSSYPDGARFCSISETVNQFCCHPAVALRFEDTKEWAIKANWHIKGLSNSQQYAVGFRSSFQCEQYSKSVCEHDKDRCSLRVLDLTTSVPGEYPHQAMIGVQGPFLRLFHCGGSLVSKQFILSAAACQIYEKGRCRASIALLGEYDTTQFGEFGQREHITFLSKIYVEPHFPKEKNTPRLALYKMWRTITFHPWRRPACIDWRGNYQAGDQQSNLAPSLISFSGFGPESTGGRWNRTLKRLTNITLNPKELIGPWKECLKYKEMTLNQGVYCYLKPKTSLNSGPCQYDLGAPFNTNDRNQAPYCTWKVWGVNIIDQENCNSTKPLLYKVPTEDILLWVEEVVWHQDMHLSQFQVSMPLCNNKQVQNFRTMIHLKDRWDNLDLDYHPELS